MPLPLPKKVKRRPLGVEQAEQEARNIRQMERNYTEREEVMSPMRVDDRTNPARDDYRLFKRLRSNRRSGGR